MNDSFIKKINGKETVCFVVATYHDDETNKDYIIYTDKTYTSDNKLKLYYSLYESLDNGIKLIDIKDKSDEIIALRIIETLIKDGKN